MFTLNGRDFDLAYISLIRAGCPPEVSNSSSNLRSQAIVVEKNRQALGSISATAYSPRAIVTSGGRWREALLKAGYVRSHAYVECGSMEINADDAISCQELLSKLDSLIVTKYNAGTLSNLVPNPYIQEVYPFENYLIFQQRGQKYRQGFILDPISRDVKLTREPTPVQQMFVNAGISEVKEVMPRSQTGARYAYAPPHGNTQSSSMGGKNSDLVLMLIRNWANVNEAVDMYLDAIRNGLYKPMRPSFAPVNLSSDGKIQASLAHKGIYPLDFARWTASESRSDPSYKVKDGKKIPRSKWGYVGSPKDKSTWHLPLDTPGRAQNALSRVNQTQGIPKGSKAAVLSKIRKVAKNKGIGVSDKPSKKQKTWIKKGKAA